MLKYLIRVALLILIATFSLNAFSATRVVFLNGGGYGNSDAISYTQGIFKETMENNGLQSPVIFDPFPILEGVFASAESIKCQQNLSRKSFVIQDQNPGIANYHQYLMNLGALYANFDVSVKQHCVATPGEYKNLKTITTALFNKIKLLVESSETVVLIGHSQGSHFGETVIAMLLFKGVISTHEKIKIVNFGSMSATASLSARYTNIKQDALVYDTGLSALLGFGASWPWILPYSVDACIGECMNSATIKDLESVGADNIGHRIYTYLNSNIFSLADKVSLPKKIANHINGAIAELTQVVANPTKTFTVVASSYPGIDFTNPNNSASTCTVTANGSWNNGPTANFGPNGASVPGGAGVRLPSAPSAALIAVRRSGGADVSAQLVGASGTINLTAGEAIYFSTNDSILPYGGQPHAYFDNIGSMSVTIQCPG